MYPNRPTTADCDYAATPTVRVYDRNWTPFSLVARGLVLDMNIERVAATRFPKFFNLGERGDETIPDLPFETFEKVDRSLIIIFWHAGEWRTATKGSLRSDQAVWARQTLAAADLSHLERGTTYLAEAVYPENASSFAMNRPALCFWQPIARTAMNWSMTIWARSARG